MTMPSNIFVNVESGRVSVSTTGKIYCLHEQPAVRTISHSAANPNRPYWACSKDCVYISRADSAYIFEDKLISILLEQPGGGKVVTELQARISGKTDTRSQLTAGSYYNKPSESESECEPSSSQETVVEIPTTPQKARMNNVASNKGAPPTPPPSALPKFKRKLEEYSQSSGRSIKRARSQTVTLDTEDSDTLPTHEQVDESSEELSIEVLRMNARLSSLVCKLKEEAVTLKAKNKCLSQQVETLTARLADVEEGQSDQE